MADGAIASAAANIRYNAATTLSLGAISTVADVSLIASSITDSGTTDTDVTADELRIVTTGTDSGNGAGTSSNHLEIDVNTLAADIDGTGTGGLFLTESDAVTIDSLNDIAVNRVASNGTTSETTDASLSDIDSAAHVVLVTTNGGITVNEGDSDDTGVNAAGNILLQAGGTSDITLNADVTSTGENISMNAGRDILQNADISTATEEKTIDLIATRNLTMGDGTSTQSTNGNIFLQAGTDVTIEEVAAGAGSVSITATAGDIIDRDTAGDTEVDITANGLLLNAGSGIATSDNHLETTVTTLTASAAADGIFITETDGVTVDTLTIQVNRVDNTATATETTNTAQEDLSTTDNGHIVLVSTTGTITLSDEVTTAGSGNILLNAAAGAITQNNAIDGGTGNITVLAHTDIDQGANIATIGTGTIDVEAQTGSITMAAGSVMSTGDSVGGNIRVYAKTNATVTGIESGTGNVSIISETGSILDAGGNDGTDISASQLHMVAGNGIGESGVSMDMDVEKISASAGAGGMYLYEANDIAVDGLDDIGVKRVNPDATTTDVVDVGASDLTTTDGGPIVLITQDGSIVIADGSDGNSKGVEASGGGRIYLKAQGDGENADVILNAGLSGEDNIDVFADDDIEQSAGADIETVNGEVELNARDQLVENGSISSTTGNIVKTSEGPATFIWQPVSDTTLYYVTIERNGAVFDSAWVYGTSQWVQGYDLPWSDYDIKVYSYGSGDYGDAVSIRTVRIGEITTLLRPTGTLASGSKVTFEWEAVEGSTRYLVEVEKDGTDYISEWIDGTTVWTVDSLDAGSYSWVVRPWNPDGFGILSDPVAFIVQG